ncbi:MAG TPA: CoA transferase [Dehalococcoidia bacterium]|nr:CoA transferase [Dehalococcoidia bacterium]
MTTDSASDGALAGVRVIDLTGALGAWAAKLLGDFGADVVKVEPPGGAPTRRYEPFLGGQPDTGPSLWFAYHHANARSVALDLDRPEDRARFRDLAAGADVVLEDSPPAYLAGRGLGYADLAAANPRLILASVTGFGQTGPHAAWRATDLIAWSMAGATYLSGLPDREPLASAGQTAVFAGFYAAHGILLALEERARSRLGQHVEVSAQEAVAAHNEMVLPYIYMGEVARRIGSEYLMVVPCQTFPCRDGYVMIATVSQGQWAGLVEWLTAEGAAEDLVEERWTDQLVRIAERDHVHAVIRRWVAGYRKWDLFHAAQARSLPFAVVSTTADLAHDDHLIARQALPARDWAGTGRAIAAPGPIARLGEGGARFRRLAPAAGEHTIEVLAEANGRRTAARGTRSVDQDLSSTARGRSSAAGPLAGLKVADFTWVVAGPSGTRILADFGATVVKVEAIVGGDNARFLPPYRDSIRGENRSGFFNAFNRNKLSLKLDLKHPDGVAVARRLAAWADVVTANFSAGTMDRFGLGYETLRQANPGLIMAEMPGFGASGPYRDYVSYALTLQALSGITNLTGYPDAPPTGVGFALADHLGGQTLAWSVLLGLAHRRRTGRGQWIEIAQIEASLATIGPAVLDYFANGSVWPPRANAPTTFRHGPTGVFPCAGPDRWVAIDVETDDEWQALCRAIDRPDLAADPAYATPDQRAAKGAELAEAVTAWTSRYDPWEAAATLQRAGVPAGPVCDAVDLIERDRHLAERGFYQVVDHPEIGPAPVDRSPIRLSRTPGSIRARAPLLGEHTEYVLGQVLGLPQEEIDRLLIEGVV